MLEAIEAIERHMPIRREALDEDELLQGWFVLHLLVLGEAAAGVPNDVRALEPGIPWSKIVGMRNVLVHGYFSIDNDIVWQTLVKDVPPLKSLLLALVDRSIELDLGQE